MTRISSVRQINKSIFMVNEDAVVFQFGRVSMLNAAVNVNLGIGVKQHSVLESSVGSLPTPETSELGARSLTTRAPT